MTTIGHSLTGLSLAALTLPAGRSRRWYVIAAAIFVFFANVADFPLPGWGHSAYHVSHSIFVTALLASLMALLLFWPTFHAKIGVKVIAACRLIRCMRTARESPYSGHSRKPTSQCLYPGSKPSAFPLELWKTFVYSELKPRCLGQR